MQGLAVGEIGPLMAAAKGTRLDKLYELAADYEMLKYQVTWCFNRCHCCFLSPWNSAQRDLTKEWKCTKNLKKALLTNCAREADDSEVSEEEGDDEQLRLLNELKNEVYELNPNKKQALPNSRKKAKS